MIVFAVGAAWGAPRAARADDDAAAAAIAGMSRRALEDYENLNFESARRRLDAALEECTRVGLSWHAVAAEAHVLMGVVLLAGGDQRRPEAVAAFQKALAIQPSIKVPERVGNPEIQQVFAEAAKVVSAAPPPDETPAAARGPKESKESKKGAHAKDDPAAAGAAQEIAEVTSEPAPAGSLRHHAWFVGFSVGGGLGWTSGSGEVTDARVASGFRPASFGHVLPELGYFATPNVVLSLQLRVQFVSGATSERDPTMTMCGSDHVCSPSHGATAVFARAAWFLGDGPTLRPFLSGAIGGGQIRHRVVVPGPSVCGTDPAHPADCVDTVAAGPVFVGPGAGCAVNLTRNFSLLASANTLFGFPRFTFHVDVNAGVGLEF